MRTVLTSRRIRRLEPDRGPNDSCNGHPCRALHHEHARHGAWRSGAEKGTQSERSARRGVVGTGTPLHLDCAAARQHERPERLDITGYFGRRARCHVGAHLHAMREAIRDFIRGHQRPSGRYVGAHPSSACMQ